MKVGIVGAEAAKFTELGQERARTIIRSLLQLKLLGPNQWVVSTAGPEMVTLVSGGCHLGGIDKWAEEEANKLAIPKLIHLPKKLSWDGGFKQRNILIAKDSAVVHNIVVLQIPEGFKGMRFSHCYHSRSTRSKLAKLGFEVSSEA